MFKTSIQVRGRTFFPVLELSMFYETDYVDFLFNFIIIGGVMKLANFQNFVGPFNFDDGQNSQIMVSRSNSTYLWYFTS